MKYFTIPIGTPTHIFGIVCYTLFGILGCIFIQKMEQKKQKIFIFSLLLFGFILHFFKLAFAPYKALLPKSIRKITFENICAVSTLIFPFIFLSKNKYLKDYMFYMGVISGTAAILVPATDYYPYLNFDTCRFYLCHMVIGIAPLLMVVANIHTLDYHRIWMLPILFLCVQGLIAMNDVIMVKCKLINQYPNFSLQFGVSQKHEDMFGPFLILLTGLCPSYLKTANIVLEGITTSYVPVLWLIIPAFVYLSLLSFIIAIPFEKKHMRQDFQTLSYKIKKMVKRNS